MKKLLTLALAALLLFACTSALAAGKLQVMQENFHVVASYTTYCYAYARVENVGDKPIRVNAGLLEVYDAEGESLTSTDWMNEYPQYLDAGEYGYVKLSDDLDKDKSASDVDDYLLTVTGKAEKDYLTKRLPCTTEFRPNVKEGYFEYNYMYITVKNDTENTMYDINVIGVLLDDADNILYMESDSLYNVGIDAGSSVTIRISVSDSFMETYEKEGLVPTKVDAIAYVSIKQ